MAHSSQHAKDGICRRTDKVPRLALDRGSVDLQKLPRDARGERRPALNLAARKDQRAVAVAEVPGRALPIAAAMCLFPKLASRKASVFVIQVSDPVRA